MDDIDNMLTWLLHMSLSALWDTDASEAGINLCAKACRNPGCIFIDVSVAVHLFDLKITPLR
jgi:hypothetical protein